MRIPHLIIMLAVVACLMLTGCVSDQSRADISNSAQASYNAAAAEALEADPARRLAETSAIEANQVAIAQAVGIPLNITATVNPAAPAAPVPPGIPPATATAPTSAPKSTP
jgi:hypothetical protein